MKKLLINSFVFTFIFCGGLFVTYLAIHARQVTNPNLTEPAPTGGLYVNNNETLSAAKRNALAGRVQSFPQETLANWQAGTEQDTGIKRIDGKEIYRKVVNLWAMSNVWSTVTSLTVNHNISNLDRFVKFEWMLYAADLNTSNQRWIGQYETNYSTAIIWNRTTLTLRYMWPWSWRTVYAIAYYIKS